MRKCSQCLVFADQHYMCSGYLLTMVWIFDDEIKSDRSINKLSLNIDLISTDWDVIELSPIECQIYSFHSVGTDVSMEVEIESIHDSF